MTTNGHLDLDDLEYINANIDRRPPPKDRKNARLWQAFLIWDELVNLRKRHLLRLTAIERGKSNMDADTERNLLIGITPMIEVYRKEMLEYGEALGPVWGWITSIKGLGAGNLAAQLLAQIDDPGKFDTVSKLWAFSGYAVVDGRRQYYAKNEPAPYNRKLKSTCWLITDQFIRQRTPMYRDIYDREKEELRRVHPEPIEENGRKRYTDGHIDAMARRKVSKIFLSHVWDVWRRADGLPVSPTYVEAIMGHTNIIKPTDTTQAVALAKGGPMPQ